MLQLILKNVSRRLFFSVRSGSDQRRKTTCCEERTTVVFENRLSYLEASWWLFIASCHPCLQVQIARILCHKNLSCALSNRSLVPTCECQQPLTFSVGDNKHVARHGQVTSIDSSGPWWRNSGFKTLGEPLLTTVKGR